MPKFIPPEVQTQINEFYAQEQAKKVAESGNGETKKQRRFRESILTKNVFTPRELMQHAQSHGWKLTNTEGSHCKFTNEDGEILIIPARAGAQATIQPDTAQRILKKIFPSFYK